MDLQTRKISFVQEFLNLQSEEIISLFEKLLKKEKKNNSNSGMQRMSMDDFNKRIDKSLKDSTKGRLSESGELKSEIEKWD